MTILIVLIIIVVVSYFIDQSLPKTKFGKAQNLINSKDFSNAIKILNRIFDRHIDAPAKLAECNLKLGQQASGNIEKMKCFKEATSLRKRISNSTAIAKFDNIEAKVLFEIAKIQYEETNGDVEKLTQNIRFIDNSNRIGSESEFASLRKKHIFDLANGHFKNAVDKEKSGKYYEAIKAYKSSKEFADKANNTIVGYNTVARIAICQLKLNEIINFGIVTGIEKSDKNYQIDFYYRYAIQLLKRKDYSLAEKIISSHLNFESIEIDRLKEILKAEKNNNAIKQVEEINISIKKLYDNSLLTEELEKIYENLDETVNAVSELDKQLSEKISAIKPNLFNRLLSQNISEENYENAIKLILKYPRFWESTELLKNLGICCYGFSSKGLLTERNYSIVISGWLTAVFSDKVILKSLEDTTWDDNYTFTLSEAIGSNHSQHSKIPENVNYDEVSETNISIGSTQRELLKQFETIIHKEIQDVNLSKLVNDFYDKEKESLIRIIKIIENNIFFASPYFSKSYGLNNEIIKELDNDYKHYSNEEALEAGIPYIKDSQSSNVYQYSCANDLIEKIKSAIESENWVAIKNLNTQENKHWIEKFDNIHSSTEDTLFNSISKRISEDDQNERLILVMEECIAISKNNEKLKYLYSSFVANYCISKVNNEQINNFKALTLMKGAYFYSPDNPKICKNLITLIRFNLMDILNERTNKPTDVYNVLDWIKNNMSNTFKQNNNELRKARMEILQQLKETDIDLSLFEDNAIGTAQRAIQTLNAQGLMMKVVLNYLKELGKEEAISKAKSFLDLMIEAVNNNKEFDTVELLRSLIF